MVREDAMSSPITLAYGASHILDFLEHSRRSKTLSQLRVEEVKTINLDDYRAMLNTGPLGGEGVSFYVIVFCSITERNN